MVTKIKILTAGTFGSFVVRIERNIFMIQLRMTRTQADEHIFDRLHGIFGYDLDLEGLAKSTNKAAYLELIAKRYRTSVEAIFNKLENNDNWGMLRKIEERYGVRLKPDCPSAWIAGKCECGQVYAKQIDCGREWCPICGDEWSPAHQRRFARWWGKVSQMPQVGYIVATIPPSRRPGVDRCNPKAMQKTLAGIRKRFVTSLKSMGYARGLSRWHWYGDANKEWHPHLNVLIDDGAVSMDRLEAFKQAWRDALGLTCDESVSLHYRYRDTIGKVIHTVKYVTRATFRYLDSYDKCLYAAGLHGFRNNHWWGYKKWDGEEVWILSEGKGQISEVVKLEGHICPECGGHVVWSAPKSMKDWARYVMTEIGGGYFLITGVKKRCG